VRSNRGLAAGAAALLFFLAYAWLFVFIDRFRSGVPQSFLLFWAPMLLMFATISFQIVRLRDGLAGEVLVVFQLVLVSFFFHVVHMVLTDGTLLLQDDGYTMLESTAYIQQGNRDFLSAGPDYGRWPLSQLLLLWLSYASGLSLYDVAWYLPAIINTVGTVFLYLLARAAFGDRRVALFGFLVFGFWWFYGLRLNSFHPEFMAYIFMTACLFAFFRSLVGGFASAAMLLLAVAFLGVSIPTNITTSAFLAGIILLSLPALWLARIRQGHGLGLSIPADPVIAFAALALVAVLAYSVYIAVTSFEVIVGALADIRPPVYAPAVQAAAYGAEATVGTLRQNVSAYGFMLYVLLFGGAMVAELLARWRCRARYSDVLFTLWGGVGFVLYLIWGLVPIGVRFFSHFGGRVQNFVFPFLAMGAAHAVVHASTWRRQTVFAVLLAGFVVVSVSSLLFVPGGLTGTGLRRTSEGDNSQEWAVLTWLQGTYEGSRWNAGSIVATDYIAPLFKYRTGGYPITRIEFWEQNLAGLKERRLDWVVMNPDEPVFETFSARQQLLRRRLDADTLAQIARTPWLAQSYDNGEWSIYKVVR